MQKPIFFDHTNTRKRKVQQAVFLLGGFFLFGLTIFIISLFLHPILPLPHIFHDITPIHHFQKGKIPPSIHTTSPHHRENFVATGSGKILPEKRKVYAF